MPLTRIDGFEHLHQHTHFSLLDGYAFPLELAERAKKINQQFLCVTDHGAMGVIPEQIRACDKFKLNSIYGCEFYINSNQPELKEGEVTGDYAKELGSEEEKKRMRKSNHLLAIAYTNEGYSNLTKLSSWSWMHGFYYKPRINYDILKKNQKNIIFTSCCYNSEIGQAFDRGGDDEGFSMIELYIEMLGKENFYLTIMLNDFKKQKPYNVFIQKACQKYGLSPVLENDVHYCNKEDSKYQRYMIMIQTKKTLADIAEVIAKAEAAGEEADVFELQDSNLWMKSEGDLNQMFEEKFADTIDPDFFAEAKRNTVRICQQAKGVTFDRSIKLPNLPDADDKLKEAVIAGLVKRGLAGKKEYVERIKEEFSLIKQKEFSSYFLIQKMMTDEARRWWGEKTNGYGDEAVGVGRGCLQSNAGVFISNGNVKRIKDVEVGEEVFVLNGEKRKVLNKFIYDCNENLINIKSYYGRNKGITLTSDHKIFIEKAKRPKNWNNWSDATKASRKTCEFPIGQGEWVEAKNVEVGDWVFIPKPKLDSIPVEKIDLAKYCDGEATWFDEDFVYEDRCNPLTKKLACRKQIRRFIIVDKQFMMILGLFAGDGWWRSNESGVVGFAFHKYDNVFGKASVLDFSNKQAIPQTVIVFKKKKLTQVFLRSKLIKAMFEDFFSTYKCTSRSKHVPQFIFNQSDDFRMAFLRGVFLSDGGVDECKIKITTTSHKLASQLRLLCWSLGIPASDNRNKRFDKRTGRKSVEIEVILPYVEGLTFESSKNKYVYHNTKDGIWTKVREVTKVTGVKKVYDLQIEGDQSNYLTDSFLVHNSAAGSLISYCLRITDIDPIKHDLLFSRFLSPARGGKTMKMRFTSEPIVV